MSGPSISPSPFPSGLFVSPDHRIYQSVAGGSRVEVRGRENPLGRHKNVITCAGSVHILSIGRQGTGRQPAYMLGLEGAPRANRGHRAKREAPSSARTGQEAATGRSYNSFNGTGGPGSEAEAPVPGLPSEPRRPGQHSWPCLSRALRESPPWNRPCPRCGTPSLRTAGPTLPAVANASSFPSSPRSAPA